MPEIAVRPANRKDHLGIGRLHAPGFAEHTVRRDGPHPAEKAMFAGCRDI